MNVQMVSQDKEEPKMKQMKNTSTYLTHKLANWQSDSKGIEQK